MRCGRHDLSKPEGDLNVERRAGDYVRAFLETGRGTGQPALQRVPRRSPRSAQSAAIRYPPVSSITALRYVAFSNPAGTLWGNTSSGQHRQMEMLHAVPRALAKNKNLAALYGRHWNDHVSPGQPVYARSGDGEELIELAIREEMTPGGQMHRKEVFL